MNERIGIDLGGVVIDSTLKDGKDTFFTDDYLEAPSFEGALDAVTRVVDHFGRENVFFVSKCRESTAAKSRLWLRHHGYFEQETVDSNNIVFCRKRPEKAAIANELKLTWFIDNMIDVLEPMDGMVENRVLFGPQVESCPDDLLQAETWQACLKLLNI